MCKHRTALRLRVSSPVLLSQNNRQLNSSQSLSLTDFEGSRFNRWFRQGSGQHPLTGSPQHQWGFLVSGKPGNRLTACCSGALAVLFGSGQSPGAGHHYYQGCHQGCGLGSAGVTKVLLASCLISLSRNLIRSLASKSCDRSSPSIVPSRTPSNGPPDLLRARAAQVPLAISSGMSMYHRLRTLSPVSNPLANLRLIVLGEIFQALAVSFVGSCITQSVTHQGQHYSPRHISPCHILDHQDCDFGLGAGGNWRIISATWPLKKVISSLSCLTNSLSSGSGSGWPWSSISTNNIRRLFCIFFSAFNVPALMALRIVPVWQFRSLAASSIVTCMLLPVACASCLSRVYRQYLVQACTCLCRFEANCLCMYKILPIHGCALCKQVRNG